MFVFVSPLTCGTGPGSHRWWWRQLSPMVSAELNTGRRWKGSEITTALNQGATNQESSLLTLWINSNEGADFGASLSIWATSDRWFWFSPLPRREILRIPGYKEHLKGILGITLICSFPPWSMPPHPHSIYEKGEAQEEEVGILESNSGALAV